MNRIGFTTSRSPANKTRSFVHDIIKVVPRSERIVRGSSKLIMCVTGMRNRGFETAIVIHSVKGNPNFMRIIDLKEDPQEIPFAVKIRGITLSRDYQKKQKNKKPAYSVLISSLRNPTEEEVIRRVFGITKEKIENVRGKEFVTVYADYLDEDEKIIFIEFLNSLNKQVGPRLKIKIIPREPENLLQ
jgi:rRNA maturation protein Rpf1